MTKQFLRDGGEEYARSGFEILLEEVRGTMIGGRKYSEEGRLSSGPPVAETVKIVALLK